MRVTHRLDTVDGVCGRPAPGKQPLPPSSGRTALRATGTAIEVAGAAPSPRTSEAGLHNPALINRDTGDALSRPARQAACLRRAARRRIGRSRPSASPASAIAMHSPQPPLCHAANEPGVDELSQALRVLGSRAHQLRATTRAADHYCAQADEADRNTGAWLMSCAVGLAEELASDIDGLARSLRDAPRDSGLQQAVAALRVRAHQLHAATRAADHFLEQESKEDHETGSWLIACALGVAGKLAAQLDDSIAPARKVSADRARAEPHDPKRGLSDGIAARGAA